MNMEDVVRILETCQTTGVKRFKSKDLDVRFYPSKAAVSPQRIPTQQDVDEELEAKFQEDEDLNDLELQTLMITDPMAYEELLGRAQDGQVGRRPERDVPSR